MNLLDLYGMTSARPLVMQCGAEKLPGTHPAGELYVGPVWATFRAACAERGSPLPFPVYVLSAKYGLVPLEQRIATYDAVLAARPKASNEVAVETLLPLLRRQMRAYGLSEVDVSGAALYADALEQAGLIVHRLETRGIGYQRQALRRHILRT